VGVAFGVLVLIAAIVWIGRRDVTAAEAPRKQEAQVAQVRRTESAFLPGGAPERPLAIDSPAEVEPRATTYPCIHCGHHVSVKEHAAETIGGVRLRLAHVGCARCGRSRVIYFRLRAARA
jgi:hypothetical protein